MIAFSVLTVSDSCSQGRREDISGKEIVALLEAQGHSLVEYRVSSDGESPVAAAIRQLCVPGTDLLLTTGGTGFSPRDLTPEATASVVERNVPGIPEMLRCRSSESVPTAWLSRGTAGILDNTLVVNLPGSVKAVRQCVCFLLPLLGHSIEVLRGNVDRCGG